MMARSSRTWSSRVWFGASAGTFAKLLWKNRFAVHPGLLPIVAADGLGSLVNTTLGGIESALYRAVRRTQPRVSNPVFILGHWRTGTTLLHELLALDPRLVAPTAYECLAPQHFLLTARLFPRALRFLMPERRPMDDMAIGFNSPFEDEFALCLLGARSPYETLAFPNRGPMTAAMFDPEEFPARERAAWRRTMTWFVQKLALRRPDRRLVLKSPPHTCRIRTLLELFPDAAFVHIVRSPYEVFPSMVHTWKQLQRAHGWQRPHYRGLEDMVLEMFSHVYGCLERDRTLIPPDRFHELRYEDLVADPVASLDRLYAALGLGDPAPIRPAVRRYFAERRGYRRNRFQLDPRCLEQIEQRWGDVIRRYDYPWPVLQPVLA